MSGDINPQHIDAEFAASTRFQGVIAHGMWGAALISAVLGTRLPGPGTIYAGQTLKFHAPVRVGDTLTISVVVAERDEAKHRLVLDCNCTNQEGKTVISGQATVIAPTERIERPRGTLPQVRVSLQHGDELVRVLQYVKPLGRIRVAVVYPCDEVSLSAALDARTAGVIEPVLIGPRARLEAVAQKSGANLREVAIEDVPHSHAAATRAVELALKGEVEALMKGSLHTDELMTAVVKSALRTDRRMSHCFIMQTPAYPRLFIITDAAINIAPTLQDKADIIRNAVDLAHASASRAARRHPRSGRDHQPQHAGHAGCGGALQDGRPRPDHRRDPRRPARLRQRRVRGRRAHQGNRFRSGRRSRHPRGSRSRSRQHAREAARVPRRRGERRHRPRRTRADHPHRRADSREARIASRAPLP